MNTLLRYILLCLTLKEFLKQLKMLHMFYSKQFVSKETFFQRAMTSFVNKCKMTDTETMISLYRESLSM